MGRLPKGFKHNVHKHDAEGSKAAAAPPPQQQQDPAPASPSKQPPGPEQPKHQQEHAAKHQGSSDEQEGDGPETHGQMVQRHKRVRAAVRACALRCMLTARRPTRQRGCVRAAPAGGAGVQEGPAAGQEEQGGAGREVWGWGRAHKHASVGIGAGCACTSASAPPPSTPAHLAPHTRANR